MSTYFETKAMPATLSGYKAHIYCEDAAQVEIAWNRIKDEVGIWGWGAKVAGPAFFDLVDPSHKQWGKGVTVYFPRRAIWKEDLDHLVRLMAGRPENVQKPIQGDTYAGNGVSWRFEFSPDPGYDIMPGDVMQWYKEASTEKVAVGYPMTIHRGINVEMDKPMAIKLFEACARDASPSEIRAVVLEAMAKASRTEWWSAGQGSGSTGAGTWWTTSESDAVQYSSGSSDAYYHIAVILTAEVPDHEVWEQWGSPDRTGAWFYQVPVGTPMTITKIEAYVPYADAAKSNLQEIEEQGQWGSESFWGAERQIIWNERMQTTAALRTETMGPLYHGTNSLAAAEIDQHGLVMGPRNGSHSDGAIWLTPSYETARRFAESSAEIHGGEPVVYEIPSITGVPATEVGYLDLDMALEAGADYSPQGPEVAVMNPKIIREINRIATKAVTASGGSAYRGFNVPLHDNATVVRLLGDLAEGRTDSTIKVVLDTIASGQRESWWEPSPYADGAGAGTWWSRASHDAESYSTQADGFGIPVVFTARTDDTWEPHAGVNGQAHWYRLPPGLSVEITSASATLPSPGVAEYLLMMIERAGLKLTSFQAADWNEEREGIDVPLPTGGLPRTASIGPNDPIYRALREVKIPYDESEGYLSAQEVADRAIAQLRSEGYGPERPGEWWFVNQDEGPGFGLSGAKYWAGSFGYPHMGRSSVGFIYEARFTERPDLNLGNSSHIPGRKITIVAVHVTDTNDQWQRVELRNPIQTTASDKGLLEGAGVSVAGSLRTDASANTVFDQMIDGNRYTIRQMVWAGDIVFDLFVHDGPEVEGGSSYDIGSLVLKQGPNGLYVHDIRVDYKREGWGTLLFETAQRVLGPLGHSDPIDMTPAGLEWSKSVGRVPQEGEESGSFYNPLFASRTASTTTTKVVRGFAAQLPEGDRPLAERFRDGTATADDVIRVAMATHNRVGVHWGILDGDFDWDVGASMDYAYAEETPDNWLDDDYDDGIYGEVGIVLVGTIPFDPMVDNPAAYTWSHEIASGTQVTLEEVHYLGNQTTGWKTLPARGMTVTSKKTSALDNEALISVAEHTMERLGLDGETILVPEGHRDDPAYQAAIQPLQQWVRDLCRDPQIRFRASNYELDAAGVQALTDGMNKIVVRPVTSTMTILHEVAHVLNRSASGSGHDDQFIDTLARLYAKHIGQEAADVFLDIARPG